MKQEYEEKYDQNSASNINSNTQKRGLISATNGFGIRLEKDEAELKREKEEAESYLPFSKRMRTEEENYSYIQEAENQKIKLKNLKISETKAKTSSDKIEVKSEPMDSSEIIFYNNLDYNFFNHEYDKNLPIIGLKDEILCTLRTNNILIIQGNTGCGKTTQVPQIILDDAARNSQTCRIIVTQPRRIAAKSISKRVCEERNWEWGSVCGFKVSLDRKCTKDTKIFYVTTGYLLELIVAVPNELEKYTHIILDEIHDRDTNTDFILLLVKLMLMHGYKGKVILMSATLDPEPLMKYFSMVSLNKTVPVITCSLNLFDVTIFYLDHLESKLSFKNTIKFDTENPRLYDEQCDVLVKLFEYIDKREIQALRPEEETINGLAAFRGAALIFVPGMEQINYVQEYLQRNLPNNRLVFCQLHRDIALEQQMRAFDSPALGYRKIIISTSIAESSVTVPDISYVIDFCLTKSPYTDPATNYTSLELEWASKSNMKQRTGRAGRVNRGICYRLITKDFYSNKILDYPRPAIERESLDKLILNIKRFNTKDAPKKVLALALTPPALDKIERTVLFLKEAGALSLYKNREICSYDGDLTFAGSIMATLPIDIKLSKLILLGYAFGRLRDAVILAAALSAKNLFKRFHKSAMEHYKNKFYFSNGMMSDFSCIINAYNLWQAHVKHKTFKNKRELRNWVEDNMISYESLMELEKIKHEIQVRLEKVGIIVEDSIENVSSESLTKTEIFDEQTAIDECYILKFMIAGAFYPNYFKTSITDEKEVIRSLNGKNARSTILVRGFREPAMLYHNKLKEIFKICSKNLIMHYENQKAFIEFKDFYSITNKISDGVYLAAALTKLDLPLYLPRADERQANKIKKEIDYLKSIAGINYSNSYTSRLTTGNLDESEDVAQLLGDLNEFAIKVVVISDLNYFWAQIDEENNQKDLEYINETLNDSSYVLKVVDMQDLKVGKMVVSFHFTGNESECGYYRAKITKVNESTVNILYIDYGNSEEKDFDLIFEISEELSKYPNQAFQCELAHLKPDHFATDTREKLNKAVDEFSSLLSKVDDLKARVYSIVDNIARIELIDADNPLFEYNISSKLIKIGLFERVDESLNSKLKHEERMNRYFFEGKDGSKSENEWINVKNLEEQISQLKFNQNDEFKISTYSPIDASLNGMSRWSRQCRIKVERSSINNIILDEDSSIKCSTLLVSHKTSLASDQDKITLVNTCLFPKIAGLVSLCLLIFAPEVEFRIDERSKAYTGALCGLGYDSNLKKPLYTENDVEEVFEVEFGERDITLINSVRTALNLLIGGKIKSKFLANNPELISKFQKDTRSTVLALLKEKRKLKQAKYFDREFRWNQLREENLKALNANDKKMHESKIASQVFYMPIRAVDFNTLNRPRI